MSKYFYGKRSFVYIHMYVSYHMSSLYCCCNIYVDIHGSIHVYTRPRTACSPYSRQTHPVDRRHDGDEVEHDRHSNQESELCGARTRSIECQPSPAQPSACVLFCVLFCRKPVGWLPPHPSHPANENTSATNGRSVRADSITEKKKKT